MTRRDWPTMDELSRDQHLEWHRLIGRACDVAECPERLEADDAAAAEAGDLE